MPWVEEEDVNKEFPTTRVISFFGISNTNIDAENIKRRRVGWGPTNFIFSPYGGDYDKGHFIAHGFGGPVDVNIFPQRRDVNRGWSEEGKRYRKMERYVAANPGTLVFSRPIFQDLTECPYFLEYGYFDKELNSGLNWKCIAESLENPPSSVKRNAFISSFSEAGNL